MNFEFYNNEEFSNWADKDGLNSIEQKLSDKYLSVIQKDSKILEIGTGNGRILFSFASKGYTNLQGIDLSEKLLKIARLKAIQHFPLVKFYQMNVAQLEFPNYSFDMVIALQQVLCLVGKNQDRMNALRNCYRVLKPRGWFIASFLYYEGRWYNPVFSTLTLPVKFLKNDWEFLNYQYIPWLKPGNKLNWQYLWKKQPYLYWFRMEEIQNLMNHLGFKTIEFFTAKMFNKQTTQFNNGGMLYLVAQK